MLERRYLVVPGIGSLAAYVLDAEARPARPQGGSHDQPEELAAKAGYSRPYRALRSRGASSCPTWAGPIQSPGGVALIDHDTFEVTGAWETDRGEQRFAYDVWWHLNHDVAITSKMASPSRWSSRG